MAHASRPRRIPAGPPGNRREPARALWRKLRLPLWVLGAFVLAALLDQGPPLLRMLRALGTEGLPRAVVDKDFATFWMAGRLALAGQPHDLFFQPLFFRHLLDAFGLPFQIHNFAYPPHFLLLVWPLGLLGYQAALVAFLLVTATLFAASAELFRREFAPGADRTPWLLSILGYAVMMAFTTQNGFLTAAAMLSGLAWMRRRPVLAGLAFALLTVKPQLGLLVPVLLLFDRNWRTLAWSTLFTLALLGLSAGVFGWASWHAYGTETLAYQRFVMTHWYGLFLRMMPTTFASLRTLGCAPDWALAAQAPVSLAGAGLFLWVLWRRTDPLHRAFAMLCATFLVTPYAFNYDLGALAVSAGLLVGTDPLRTRRPAVALGLCGVAGLAGVVTALGQAGLPVAPLLLAAGLAAIAADGNRIPHTP